MVGPHIFNENNPNPQHQIPLNKMAESLDKNLYDIKISDQYLPKHGELFENDSIEDRSVDVL